MLGGADCCSCQIVASKPLHISSFDLSLWWFIRVPYSLHPYQMCLCGDKTAELLWLNGFQRSILYMRYNGGLEAGPAPVANVYVPLRSSSARIFYLSRHHFLSASTEREFCWTCIFGPACTKELTQINGVILTCNLVFISGILPHQRSVISLMHSCSGVSVNASLSRTPVTVFYAYLFIMYKYLFIHLFIHLHIYLFEYAKKYAVWQLLAAGLAIRTCMYWWVRPG